MERNRSVQSTGKIVKFFFFFSKQSAGKDADDVEDFFIRKFGGVWYQKPPTVSNVRIGKIAQMQICKSAKNF